VLNSCGFKSWKNFPQVKLVDEFGVSCRQRNRVFSDPQFCGYIPDQGAVWPLRRAKDVVSPRGNLRHQDDPTCSVEVSLDHVVRMHRRRIGRATPGRKAVCSIGLQRLAGCNVRRDGRAHFAQQRVEALAHQRHARSRQWVRSAGEGRDDRELYTCAACSCWNGSSRRNVRGGRRGRGDGGCGRRTGLWTECADIAGFAVRRKCDIVAVHPRNQASVDGGAARAAQRIVRLHSEGERADGILNMDKQRVGRIFDGVGLANMSLTAVEDKRVSAEVEQQVAATVFASHAQAYLAGIWNEGAEHAGEHANSARVVGRLRRGRDGLGIRRLRERANDAAPHRGPVVGSGSGSGRYTVFIVGTGEVADDDAALDVNQAWANEATIWAHGQHDGIRLVLDRDPNRTGPLLDAVVVRVGSELAAAIDGNTAFVEVESGDSGGAFIKAFEDYTGSPRSQQRFLRFGTEAG
jgi:hypothetical protein